MITIRNVPYRIVLAVPYRNRLIVSIRIAPYLTLCFALYSPYLIAPYCNIASHLLLRSYLPYRTVFTARYRTYRTVSHRTRRTVLHRSNVLLRVTLYSPTCIAPFLSTAPYPSYRNEPSVLHRLAALLVAF